MRNNIWFIGDCFTASYGCQPGDPYYEYKVEDEKVWTDYVADYFNLNPRLIVKLHNCSNALIVSNLVSNLHKIQTGDTVIVGTTYPTGTLVRNNDKIDSVNFKNEFLWENRNYSVDYQTLHKFLYETYEQDLNLWDEFYENQIKSIGYELSNRGVSTLLWSYREWEEGRFEKIFEHTDREIDDIHFSWKGHRKFADYIINKITNKQFISKCLI